MQSTIRSQFENAQSVYYFQNCHHFFWGDGWGGYKRILLIESEPVLYFMHFDK